MRDRPPHRGPLFALLSALTLALLAFAGCMAPDDGDDRQDGDGGGDGDPTSPAAEVRYVDHPELGSILADGDGRTLYIFTNDDPGVSNCTGGCAENWPPFVADEAPEAPAALDGRISLIDRDDAQQVTHDDRPLYHFAGDQQPGDASGDGLNGIWFVVREPLADPSGFDGEGPHAVETEEVEYHDGVMGELATPTDEAPTVGIVMIHEWWGLNDQIRDMARRLATHGHLVLAVDLFDGEVASDPDAAMEQVSGLDQEAALENMRAAAAFLRERGATSVASLGWCFGGGQSLQFALSDEDLDATVLYYGSLVTDEERLQVIDQPVLGIFGEDDGSIPVEEVRQFETALDNLSIENEIYIYPDVGHAFANPSGDNWGAEAAQDAWWRTLRFLDEHLAA